MTGYVKSFDSNKTMASYIKVLKKFTKLWEKNSNLMNIKFDSEPVYGDKLYGDKIYTNFQAKKYQKKMHHTRVYH